MDESLADEEINEVAYVLNEDAEEIIDISPSGNNGTGNDNDDDDNDNDAGVKIISLLTFWHCY